MLGTIGMIITGLLHIFLAFGLSLNAVHTSFFSMYPVFFAFLVIGVGLTVKNQKSSKSA